MSEEVWGEVEFEENRFLCLVSIELPFFDIVLVCGGGNAVDVASAAADVCALCVKIISSARSFRSILFLFCCCFAYTINDAIALVSYVLFFSSIHWPLHFIFLITVRFSPVGFSCIFRNQVEKKRREKIKTICCILLECV